MCIPVFFIQLAIGPNKLMYELERVASLLSVFLTGVVKISLKSMPFHINFNNIVHVCVHIILSLLDVHCLMSEWLVS